MPDQEICALFLDVTTEVTQKMVELCTEYLFLTIIANRSLFMLVSWANETL